MASPTILTIHHHQLPPIGKGPQSWGRESLLILLLGSPSKKKDIWPTSPIRNTQIHKTKVPLACHGDKKKDEVSVGIATSRSC